MRARPGDCHEYCASSRGKSECPEPAGRGQRFHGFPSLAGRAAEGCCLTAARILIVEDEPALMRGLKDTFSSKGFDVLSAMDGQAGLDAAFSEDPDLILLDIMLPKVNGYEICRALRQRGLEMPIVMLTAKGQEEDIVLGLNLGADDYVTKPFRIAELVARVNAFLRRGKSRGSSTYRFGDFELDMTAHKLFRDSKEVE